MFAAPRVAQPKRRLLIVLLCGWIIPCGPGLAQQADPLSRFQQAVQLQQSGDLEGAIRAYQAFLQAHPDNVEALSNLGVVFARLGRYGDAIQQYRRALEINRENPAVRFNLGVAHYKAAQIPEAARELASVVAAEPGNLNATFLLGECYLRMGDNKRVIELLTPLEAAHGDDRALLYVLGTALIRDGQAEKGQLLIDRILRDGDSAEAHLLMAAVFFMGGKPAEAIKECERALSLNPRLPSANSHLGRALLRWQEPDRAMEAFRRELEIDPNEFYANLYLGLLLKQQQRFEEALAYSQRALQVRPGAPELRYQIGSIYLFLGRYEEALAILEPLAKEEPDFVEAHVSLATIYYRLKRKEDGDRHRTIIQKLKAEEQARASAPAGVAGQAGGGGAIPEMRQAEQTIAGMTPAVGGIPVAPEAVPVSSKPVPAVVSPPPQEPKAAPPRETSSPFDELAARASAAREADRVEEAIGLYQQGVRLRPSWAEGWWYLGTLFYGADRYEEARDAFRRLVSLEPKGGAAWALLGLCEFQLRDYEQALEDLQQGRSLGLGDSPQLVQVVRYRTALLLTRFEQFEAATYLLHALARERGDHPAVVEALGITTLGLPYLPTEAPPEKREIIVKAGKAAYYLAARRMQDAERALLELVRDYPTTPYVHYSYGVFLLLADPDKALEEFRRELEISPTQVAARLQLAFEHLKRGEYAAGLPYAEQAVSLAPRSFAAHNALGRLLLELGQATRAVGELEEAVRLAPDSPETRYALARAYARAGRQQEAARERAEFARLDKLRRAQREGTHLPQESATKPPEQPPI